MAYSVIANTGGIAGTTAAINTTGADLIVLVACYDAGATVSDSKSNSWTGLTASGPARGAATFCKIWYSQAPTVGASHTFTLSISYGALFVIALSGSGGSPADQQIGATGQTKTSFQAGSITPGQNNEIVIAGICEGNNGEAPTVDSSFTVTDSLTSVSSVHYGGALAYLIQTTAGATNPTFSWTTGADCAARNASFKIPVSTRALAALGVG